MPAVAPQMLRSPKGSSQISKLEAARLRPVASAIVAGSQRECERQLEHFGHFGAVGGYRESGPQQRHHAA